MTAMAYPRALPPRKPTTASTTRSMTYPCGTGRRLDDESLVTTGAVMKAPTVCVIGRPTTRLRTGMAMPWPRQRAPAAGDDLERLGCRHVNFQIGDTVRVGTRAGTITDIGTVPIQFKTNDGCLRVACPWELVKIATLPRAVSLTLGQE
jgi:hypothetical protein